MYDKIRHILTGKESTKLYREFLKRNNHADLAILKSTKAWTVTLLIISDSSKSLA